MFSGTNGADWCLLAGRQFNIWVNCAVEWLLWLSDCLTGAGKWHHLFPLNLHRITLVNCWIQTIHKLYESTRTKLPSPYILLLCWLTRHSWYSVNVSYRGQGGQFGLEEDELVSIVIVVVIAVPPAHDRHIKTPCHDIQELSRHGMRQPIRRVVGSAVEENMCHKLSLITRDSKDEYRFLFAVGCLHSWVCWTVVEVNEGTVSLPVAQCSGLCVSCQCSDCVRDATIVTVNWWW